VHTIHKINHVRSAPHYSIKAKCNAVSISSWAGKCKGRNYGKNEIDPQATRTCIKHHINHKKCAKNVSKIEQIDI
jgi:hypothetical protein